MTPGVLPSLREWTRRVWGALSGRRTDQDLQREVAGHLALAEDELRKQGHSPSDAARLAGAAAGGRVQALEALRGQRGLLWLAPSWLDIRLGLRLLVRSWGLTLVGGLAMSVAIGIAAVVFAAFDVIMWSRLPLDEGDRVVAIQVWDREAGRRRDTTWQDVERWRASLQSVGEVGAFQTIRRNIIAPDGSVELAAVAEISAAGFWVARVPPLVGRPIAEADAAPGAAPVVVIGHDVWRRRFAGARDVIGRELRLGETYARTVTRQQEFAARHALGGSRARIVWQLFIESFVLSAAAGGVALLILRVVSVVVAGRLQQIPGGPPFWMTFDVSSRTLLFVAGLAVAGAALVQPRTGAPGHGAPGAARSRRARRTDQSPAGRHVDHAGDRAGRLLGRRAAAGRRTRLGHTANERRRPGLRRRGVCDRARRAGRRRRDLWQSPARVGATSAGRPGHPWGGGRLASTGRGALGVR